MRGDCLVIQEDVVDGMLELGGPKLVGFYLALRRFLDPRGPEAPQTVGAFCEKFGLSRRQFYRLAGLLAEIGLMDIEKSAPGKGDRFVFHCYADCRSRGPKGGF